MISHVIYCYLVGSKEHVYTKQFNGEASVIICNGRVQVVIRMFVQYFFKGLEVCSLGVVVCSISKGICSYVSVVCALNNTNDGGFSPFCPSRFEPVCGEFT